MEKTEGKTIEHFFQRLPRRHWLAKANVWFNLKFRCTAEQALEHKFFIRLAERLRARSYRPPVVKYLEANHIDLDTLKRKTFEEVRWYKDQEAWPFANRWLQQWVPQSLLWICTLPLDTKKMIAETLCKSLGTTHNRLPHRECSLVAILVTGSAFVHFWFLNRYRRRTLPSGCS
jgi:hypothetical protein